MTTVSAAEFQRKFGRYQDTALTRPVTITQHGRDRLVLMSVDEYRRLKRRARESLLASELSDKDVQAIADATVPDGYEDLDREIE